MDSHTPRLAVVAMIVALLSGCNAPVAGTYTGVGTTLFNKITLNSNESVDFTFAGRPAPMSSTYTVSGNRVMMGTNEGQKVLFFIGTNGCITMEGVSDTYCKG